MAPAIDASLHWHVARIAPRWTGRIGEALNEIGVSVFLPRSSEIVIRRGRRAVRRTPLLPRTAFVGVTGDDHLEQVAGHTGVETLVSYPIERETTGNVEEISLRPARIDPRVLQGFVDAVARGEIVQPVGVSIGSHVVVKEGPFASFPAVVEEILPADRIKVGVAIFGRSSPCELGLAQVQAID